MFPLEELQDAVLEHDEFHGLIIVEEPWKTHWVTGIPGGVSDDTRLVNDTSSHRRHSRRRQRRGRGAETMIILCQRPDSGEIMRVEITVCG